MLPQRGNAKFADLTRWQPVSDHSPTMKPAHNLSFLQFLALAFTAIALAGCDKPKQAPQAESVSSTPTPASSTNPAFYQIKGKWQRTDGDYLLEIRNVRPGGSLEATYANPQPIRVSKAEASIDGTRTKVFVELRDVNYPGCTYALTHDAAADRLVGVYFQAAQQQEFEVTFERVK